MKSTAANANNAVSRSSWEAIRPHLARQWRAHAARAVGAGALLGAVVGRVVPSPIQDVAADLMAGTGVFMMAVGTARLGKARKALTQLNVQDSSPKEAVRRYVRDSAHWEKNGTVEDAASRMIKVLQQAEAADGEPLCGPRFRNLLDEQIEALAHEDREAAIQFLQALSDSREATGVLRKWARAQLVKLDPLRAETPERFMRTALPASIVQPIVEFQPVTVAAPSQPDIFQALGLAARWP